MRFPLEVYQAVKNAVSNTTPVWVRNSATDWADDGWNLEESILFCKELKNWDVQSFMFQQQL